MAYPAPSPYPSAPGNGSYAPPPRKRGMKRIVFGALGILANLIGLVVMPLLASIVVAAFAVLNVDATSAGGTTATIETSSSSMIFVYAPAGEAASASCEVTGSDVEWDASTSGMPVTVDGAAYESVGTVTVTSSQQVDVACQGASDVAVGEMGFGSTLVGLVVGLLIPVLLGLVAIALLIWGIVARVRSSRP